MKVDYDLEDWLLNAGEKAARKEIAGVALSPLERLTREFWSFDLQAMNGGVSQYFCNKGLAGWQSFKAAWLPEIVPSLGIIFTEVDRVIVDSTDAFNATLSASEEINCLYYERRLAAWREVQRATLG